MYIGRSTRKGWRVFGREHQEWSAFYSRTSRARLWLYLGYNYREPIIFACPASISPLALAPQNFFLWGSQVSSTLSQGSWVEMSSSPAHPYSSQGGQVSQSWLSSVIQFPWLQWLVHRLSHDLDHWEHPRSFIGTIGKTKLTFSRVVSSKDSVDLESPDHSVRRARMEERIAEGCGEAEGRGRVSWGEEEDGGRERKF